MKKVFQKITSALLACLVVCSTISFTVEKHYCGPFLIDTAIFTKAKNCGMSMGEVADKHALKINKKTCCTDEIIMLQGQNELKISYDWLDFSQQLFITSFFHSYINIFSIPQRDDFIFVEYAPPDLIKDIYIIHEMYLI